jgi:hypothetical protein
MFSDELQKKKKLYLEDYSESYIHKDLVREYVDDIEDCSNIMVDDKQNYLVHMAGVQ